MALITVRSEGAHRLSKFFGVIGGISATFSVIGIAANESAGWLMIIAIPLVPAAYFATRFLILSVAWVIEGFTKPKNPN